MRRARGFTLIELVIAILVLAVLVGLAFPAYNDQVIKARRADGKALLLLAAQRQQQFFTINGAYTATVGEGGLGMSAQSPDGYYQLTITASATTYTLQAARAGAQARDSRCGDLTLTHLGVRGNSGGTLPADKCW